MEKREVGAWIIDRVGGGEDAECPRVGRIWADGADVLGTRAAILAHPEVKRFRLLDDDDSFCYGGYVTDTDAWGGSTLYALFCWAMADVGATKLYIRKPDVRDWQGPIF